MSVFPGYPLQEGLRRVSLCLSFPTNLWRFKLKSSKFTTHRPTSPLSDVHCKDEEEESGQMLGNIQTIPVFTGEILDLCKRQVLGVAEHKHGKDEYRDKQDLTPRWWRFLSYAERSAGREDEEDEGEQVKEHLEEGMLEPGRHLRPGENRIKVDRGILRNRPDECKEGEELDPPPSRGKEDHAEDRWKKKGPEENAKVKIDLDEVQIPLWNEDCHRDYGKGYRVVESDYYFQGRKWGDAAILSLLHYFYLCSSE